MAGASNKPEVAGGQRAIGRRRGRPVDVAKRTAILAAARELFLAKGYDAVTMGAIAVRARVSKATLYGHFRERSALLEAVIRRESERIIGDQELSEAAGLDLQAQLRSFGLRLLTFLTDPERLQFERLLAGAAARYPELAARFFEAGPGRARATLIALISAGTARGLLRATDPAAAAGDLVGLWQGFLRIETTLRYRQPPQPQALRRRVARGVRLFMQLYGRKRRAAAASAGTNWSG